MSHIALRCSLFVLLAGMLPAPAFCQQPVSVAGEVIQENGPRITGLTAELYDPARGALLGRSQVRPDGTFEFSGIPAGDCMLRVTAPSGDPLQQTLVSLPPAGGRVEIRLPSTPRQAPGSGIVSAARLGHKIPPKALRELRREEKAFQAGDLQGSIAHLEQALKIDPDYMEAHNNLGVRYMATSDFDKAAAEFQRAVALDPAAADALLNWAGALYALGRYEQAETAARQGLVRAPGSPRAEYVLGLTLLVERKSEQECLRALDNAAAEYPKARVFATALRQHLQAAGH